MTKVGISGHQRLSDSDAWEWVSAQMGYVIGRIPPPIVGVTSLAIGADQLFAKAVLAADGSIVAIIPFHGYARTFAEGDRAVFERFLGLSAHREVLAEAGSDEEAYLAAGRRVVDLSDLLVSVWNGREARGLGGTADIVHYAIARGKRVIQINPDDRTVTERPARKLV